jgi:N-acetyltransferase
MEWGREEERQCANGSIVVDVERSVRLKDGRKGRIVCFRADIGGKIGSKAYISLIHPLLAVLTKMPLSSQLYSKR